MRSFDMERGFDVGDTITRYEVEFAGEFGDYQPIRAGKAVGEDPAGGVGRFQHDNGATLHSFGSSGYRYRPVENVSVADVLDILEAATGSRNPDRVGGKAVREAIEEAFASADTAPRAAPERDLFGEAPVRQQKMADAQRAVDERLGAGREAVPAESRGDLFDPNRERQIDLTDARIQRVAQERGLDMPTLERAELDELDRFLREEGQLLELPDRIELDADGNPIVIGRRANEVFSDLDGQARALDAIELCAVGGAA